jgi:hypothetical protein
VRTVDRDAVEDGIPVWVIKASDGEHLHRKDDLAYYEQKREGVVETRFVPPLLNWMWPLAPDKTWTQTYTRERPVQRETLKITASCRAQSDKVTVPAGTFDTIKVTCSNVRNRRTMWERWYGPAVKAFVRDLTYFAEGAREQELIRHNIPQ